MRISFIGDDGSTDRLVTLNSETQYSTVEIEEILADKSGRSFYIKISNDETFYFWCSEKSKHLGIELLRKMKDLLKRKPFLAELTGISESRLESFAIHLRAYLVESTMTTTRASSLISSTSSLDVSVESSELGFNLQSPVVSLKPSRSRQNVSQGAKTSPLYQGSLSPRPSSFKEGVVRNFASLRSVARERLRRHGDSYTSCLDNLAVPSASSTNVPSSNLSENNFQEATGTHLLPPSTFCESLGNSVVEDPVLGSSDQVSSVGSSLFSPYYCLCPPVASALQYATENIEFSIPSSDSPSSLLSVSKSSSLLLTSKPLPNLAEVPSLDFPPLLPEPLVRLPLSIPASQQIPTFTPLMCDPIVHIPVIDVCSSGQGYLVSTGPAISTAIQPMHPNLMSPLIPEADSVVEKSARETLRLLINSSNQPNPPLLNVLPSVLSDGTEMQNIVVAGSRGLYSGTRDVHAIASSMAAIGFVSPSDRFVLERCVSRDNLIEEMEKSDGCCGPSEDVFPKPWDKGVD